MVIEGTENGNAYCYAITIPFREKASDEKTLTSEPYVMLKKKGPNKVSFGVNFQKPISANSQILVQTNGKLRSLIPFSNNYGWTYSFQDDIHLINDMYEDARFIKVEATLEDNQYQGYFSLRGISKVMRHLQQTCKVGWQGE